jgi:tetratricopeptide (TPR) repeat protein
VATTTVPGSSKMSFVLSFLFHRGPLPKIGFALRVVSIAALLLPPGFTASRLSAQAPNAAQTHERRAQEYINQKQPKLAIPEFKAVLTTDPNNLNALANLGVLLYFEQNYAEAEPYLKQALTQKPDLSKIRALLGLTQKSLGQTQEARTNLEQAVPQLSEPAIRVQAGLALIEIDMALQEPDKAAAVIPLLRQVAPTDPRVLYTAYRIYSDLSEEAMLDLSVAAPESGQMYQMMAHQQYQAGDLTSAIANLQKAAAANPNLPGIHFELAEALHISPDPQVRNGAEAEYKLAVAANSRDAKALTRIGDIAVDKNDLDQAASLYQQALAITPNDPDASIGLAHVYTEKGQPETALPLLQGVIAADPANILAHYRLSATYRAMKRPEDAKRELELYQKYKEIREKMRETYKEMRLQSPQSDRDKDK